MSIKLKGSSDGSVSFDAPADTSPSGSDITLTLPTSAGSANQFLKNSGIAGELEYSSMVETSTGVVEIKGDNATAGYLAPGLTIEQDGTGDAVLNFLLTGTQRFQMGVDNSDSDKLKIFSDAGGDFSGTGITLDTSGNVGVNTTSPNDVVSVKSTGSVSTGRGITINAAASGDTAGVMRIISSSGTQHGEIAAYSNNFIISADEASAAIQLKTAGNERMRITSGGTVLLNGQTSNPTGATTSLYTNSAGNFSEGITIKSPIGSGNRFMIGFYNNSNTKVGDIVYNGTSTAYNTTSDYRLKENVVAVTDGITRIKQLNPSRFNFIGNTETTVDGFLAHEVQSVVSEAVTGEHNGVDDSGNPVYQSIDQSKLVPLLTAALQEAIAKIETLETKVAVLEAA